MFSPTSKSPSGSQSFLWTFPDCPVRIKVHFQFIDRLRSEVLDPASIDREVGGLLIGEVSAAGKDIAVYDYYRLPRSSESNKNFIVCSDALTRAIQSWSAPHRRVIGFYRTHLEQRLRLRAGDLECIQSKFNDAMNVFLLIRPHDGRASAGFYFWQDSAVVGGLTFPFSSAELRSPDWSTLMGGPPKETRLPGPLEHVRDTATRTASGGRIGMFVAAAILVALAFALRIYLPPSNAPHTLGLRIERALLGVVVAWNPSAPEIGTAKDADLIIWDGSSPPAFMRLTSAQLHSGRTFLTSISDRVEVRLDVIGQAGAARTESAVSVARPPQANTIAPPAKPLPPRPAVSRTPASAAGEARASKPSQATGKAGAPGSVPESPVPKTSESLAELSQPRAAEEVGRGSFEAAVPIRETRPDVPPELRSWIQSDNVVEVQVHIDVSGKVTEARSAGLKGPVAGMLSDRAVNAALGWQFRPAMRAGEPVPSEKILEFLFRPSSR